MHVLVPRREDRVKTIRSLLMLAFGSFVAKLAISHQLGMLLSPPIRIVAECGAFLMICVSIIVLLGIFQHAVQQHPDSQNHTHAPGRLSKWFSMLFGGTLLIAFTWNPAALGTGFLGASSGTLSNRSTSSDASVWTLPEPITPTPSTIQSVSLAQVAIQLPGVPSRFIGHQYELTGFVYHPNGMPRDFFVLMRYFIYCCAADATPVGITIHDASAWQYLNNSWVTVSGTITTAPIPLVSQLAPTAWYQGHTNQPVLMASQARLIRAPSEPYLFS